MLVIEQPLPAVTSDTIESREWAIHVADFFEADSRNPNAPVTFSTVANAGFPSALSAL